MTTTIQAPGTAEPPASSGRIRGLQCRECGQVYAAEARHVCEMCFGPLEVAYDYELIRAAVTREEIERGPRTLEDLLTGAVQHIPHHVKFIVDKRRALGL